MSKIYDPKNWYWIIGAQVYSSAVGNYVQADDPTYLAWRADGTTPTVINSEAELGEVLAPYALRPAAAGVLNAYKDTHSRRLTIEIVAKILLWCVNEIRALKGQQALTANQFRAFVKDQM